MSILWSVVTQKVFCNFLSPKKIVNLGKMPFYAVAKGRTPGIFMTWADCESQVKGFSGARYKKFDTIEAAQNFITSANNGNFTASKNNSYAKKTQYVASTSNNNLKRSYSSSSHKKVPPGYQPNKQKSKSRKETSFDSEDSDKFSDGSDDLNTVLTKQLDDVEKRLKGFEKGVDKIIEKSTKKSNRKTILIDPPQPKRRREGSNLGFEEDDEGFVKVFTDGACSANGKSGARAGIGVYWGDGHPLNVSAPVSGRATNNCGEIQAATVAIKQAIQNGVSRLAINTDSQFLINSVTKWMPGWKRKGWKLASGEPVKNEIDFKDLDSVKDKLEIRWNYVEAHRGIHGNEMADQLAKAGAELYGRK